MIELLDSFSHSINSIFLYVFILGFIGFILHILNKAMISIKRKRISLGLIMVILLFFFGVTDLISTWIVQSRARVELRTFLNQPNLTVKKNGEIMDRIYGNQILNELKSIRIVISHHSKTIRNIELDIYSEIDTVKLTLRKDSDIETEYWVYWDKYHSTENSDFGRIKTNILK